MPMLTIEQAKIATGKSEITIRRLVKRLVNNDNALEKRLVKKLPQKQKNSYKYLIDEKYLTSHLHSQMSSHPTRQTTRQPDNETIQILKKQLEEKDEQIKTLMERMRETNVLMKGYQERFLQLEAPKTAGQKQSPLVNKRTSKPVKKQRVEQKKKKGFFSWLSS